ncbi:ABC transporter substrate-binding protein [Leucobacter luti]|uniref:Peptide/nickel transport system substrate-binding protein n=1 Tax=Leucobacter luti TaxID=340320 RepID=A0A4Q7U4J3_9MICO|nr:ABC transporter substrate-binding protein [Leucobacter luti]MBL3699540.1 ABC transporter substrate-binding protein [Leucobacter luti]RZT67052.1 peptide/nickel transport system substrate-binding protein [Leucobacter luti]
MVTVISTKKSAFVALATAALLALAGCSGGGEPASGSVQEPAGDPVSGGTLKAIEMFPTNGFDPVQVFSSTSTPITYSALYGDFLVPNPETGASDCNMCESFTTSDDGATWDVVLKDGIEFSDGTPFDATAVKFNWDRVKDPTNGSASAGFAGQIADTEVVDDLTLKLHMAESNPGFISNFMVYALQWIASPAALEQGPEEFNKNPIGAGPFTLESWTPNGVTKLVRNENYYDAPRPYLDAIEVQGVTDTTQRLNSLISGDVDAILNSDAFAFADAEAAGLSIHKYTFNGGTGLMFNTSKAPFDDVRARQALGYALDLPGVSDASTGGFPSTPTTLFPEDSPFYSDVPLTSHDPERAQELFDELADEGTPLEFTFSMTPGPSSQGAFDAIQSQLQQFENVTVTADQKPANEAGVFTTNGDYQSTVSSMAFTQPEGRLWGALYSKAGASNYSRFSDPATDAALDAAGKTDDVAEQTKQYKIVQERLAELQPYLLFSEYYNGLISTDKVQGVLMYGYTTPRVAEIWLQQ